MTGQLQTTLHRRADAFQAGDVDLPAIVRAGERRVRRRRAALAGGVAGVLAVAVGVAVASQRSTPHHLQPVDSGALPVTYAVGSVIHSGDATVDVGVHVESLVRTTRGIVFTDPHLRVYQEEGAQVHLVRTFDEKVAHADAGSPLAVGDDGREAVWWDGEQFESYPGYLLDGKTDPFPAARTWSNDAPPSVRAISSGHFYYWDGRRTIIAEVPPLRTTAFWPDSGLSDPQAVQDAAADRVLVRVGDGLAVVKANLLPRNVDAQSDWKSGTDLSGVRPQVPGITTGDLSPDAEHWFTDDDDSFAVFDSASGHRQDLPRDGFAFVAPYQWLSGDTVAALAQRTDDPDGPVSILRCRVSTNSCNVAVADAGPKADVVVPSGPTTGDR